MIQSLAIDAAVRLQPRCSEKSEKESGELSYTTRLLVSNLQIGCLIDKAGSIISEMRTTRANIRVLSKENIPKVASEDDKMVQISGEFDITRDALVHVTTCLKANLFERDSTSAAHGSSAPHHRFPVDASVGPKYHGGRDSKSHGHGFSYSDGYGASHNLPSSDTYAGYGSSQGGGSNYSSYDGYSSRYGNIGFKMFAINALHGTLWLEVYRDY
ncbi:KH domain-containing protein HEN4-like [Zingiber officinale]|uniref:KH domain-containing protein HEN4-like n=1 Tax=Zingiber officinale TaxID=94328 RepID=UPI001C4CD8CB|nr:KH domain-containing protein HEN4-like [Zingiber officinale]